MRRILGALLLGSVFGSVFGGVMAAMPARAGEIALIVKTVNSTFWQNVQKGAETAIKAETGHTLTVQGPAAESAVADQVSMVENAVTRGVAGIVLAPCDPDALVPVVKRAWEAHIPVVVIDSALSPRAERFHQAFLATDNRKAGERAAQALIERVGTEGQIAVMSYVPGVGSEVGRVGGFIDYVKAHSKLHVLGPYYSQSQMATALNQTTDVLAAYPDLKGIFGANEPTAVGMGRALKQSGKAGRIVGIGFDGNQDLQGFVKDGTLAAIVVQGSYQMGEKGVATIAGLLRKEPVDKVIDTGAVLVTRDNIGSPEARNVLY